jgi:hypothetical protein
MKFLSAISLKILFIFVASFQFLGAQELYTLSSVSFNLRDYDDIAMAPYHDGYVFSSNRPQNVFIIRLDSLNKPLFNLYFVKKKENNKWTVPVLLGKELTSRFHDGFATFNPKGTSIYFTRTNTKHSEILSAEFKDSEWSNLLPFTYNDRNSDLTHPCLSTDGKRMFFASNKPGGYGGFDIYASNWNQAQNRWGVPKNLGQEINSRSNELYPFFHSSGKLYFASNRKNGVGGLDIYYSKEINGKWIKPILMPPPVNTKDDDCAFWSDSTDRHGFISSDRNNRYKLSDVYEFTMDFPILNAQTCKPQKNNKYTYKFSEQSSLNTNATTFLYEWDFGDGKKVRGKDLEIEHTFSQPGDYLVQLNVVDTLTGQIQLHQASNVLSVKEIEQPYISCPDTSPVNHEIILDASKTYLPEKKIENFYWEFDDGSLSVGKIVKHLFSEPGIYKVVLGVTFTGPDDQKKTEVRYKQVVIVNIPNS